MRLHTYLLVFLTAGLAAEALAEPDNGARYYVSLGTSLSVGVQPDASGLNGVTDEGYADRIAAALEHPKLELVKLGCPSETSASMIEGGICGYPHGSQLEAAARFLHAHKDRVELVTIDVGSNDLLTCVEGMEVDVQCALAVIVDTASNLAYILQVLTASADPEVEFVAMNYYNPFLAFWLLGPAGQQLALQSAELIAAFNGALGLTYTTFGVSVADVAGAFHADDFVNTEELPGVGEVPRNVAVVCQLTWMCAPPPVGPNIHANAAGYATIAEAFLDVSPGASGT